MADETSRRHFSDLDGMRGVLALVVMLYHFGLNSMLNRLVPVGQVYWDLCVDFFFVLSGNHQGSIDKFDVDLVGLEVS